MVVIARGRVRSRGVLTPVWHLLVTYRARGVFSRFKLCPRGYHNQVYHCQYQCARNLQHQE